MAVESCLGYTRGCRCPKCARHRRRHEDRMAQARQDAVQERVERRARWQAGIADGGPAAPPN
ncbi:hypothetical protein P3F83_06340 [Mycobacteroides immunogenum]|nr:hypothetical protein [Mycobacteroides immunogenum]WJR34998.1 hypothetical protein P3F83_06340 [Mycobacteroides immunogenum]